MRTPEELLSNRWWRIRNSGWMLWGILSLGLLTFVGYLYIGIRARKWLWMTIGAVFLVHTIVIFSLVGATRPRSPEATAAGFLLLGGIVAGAVSPWFFNRSWLIWRARHNRNVPWYADQGARQSNPGHGAPYPEVTPASVFSNLSHTPPPIQAQSTANLLSSNAPLMPSPPTVSSRVSQALDLNSADVRQLSQLPGIDEQWAQHIVTVRQQRGGYRSPDELVTAAGMQPHIFAQVRSALVVAPQPPQPRSDPGSHPRGQSPGGGRRLDF